MGNICSITDEQIASDINSTLLRVNINSTSVEVVHGITLFNLGSFKKIKS